MRNKLQTLLSASGGGQDVWVNSQVGSPRITGNLEISYGNRRIFLGGDPDGLRSLAALLVWIADVDQEAISTQPVGERYHVHLEPRTARSRAEALTAFSLSTEICRLDAKGTRQLPPRYVTEQRGKANNVVKNKSRNTKNKRGRRKVQKKANGR